MSAFPLYGIKITGSLLSLVLVILSSLLAGYPNPRLQAAPVISKLKSNSNTIERYGKYELTFDLKAEYSNPFNPDQMRVDALITTPGRKILVQPGFFYQEYIRSKSAGGNQILDYVPGSDCWKVRFTPMELGVYSCVLEATDSTGSASIKATTFTCVASSRKGFVRADGYRLVFDDGSPYFPIGASVSWCQPFPEEESYYKWGYGQDSTYGFDAVYAEYAKYGGNWNRLWIDTGDWATPCIEGRKSYWNIYIWQLENAFGHTGKNAGRIENFAEIRPNNPEPYALSDGATLKYLVDGRLSETITFTQAEFAEKGADIAKAGVQDLAALFNAKAKYATMIPQLHYGKWYARLRARPSRAEMNRLEVQGGTAAGAFGFPKTIAQPSMRAEFNYKEFSGGWRVEGGKKYRFSGWIKTEKVAGSPREGAYFVTQYFKSPIFSGTRDWTLWEKEWTPEKNSRLNIKCVLEGAAGTAWFDDLSLQEVGSGQELGQDGGFEYETLMLNRYNMPDAWALDYILDLGEKHGIYTQLMIGRHGQPDASYQKYLRYLTARWGYSPHVLSWEFENENWHDIAWHGRMSQHLANIDVHDHLRTTSLWSALVNPDLWSLPGLTLVNLHHYRKDAYEIRVWGMKTEDPRLDKAVYHSSATSLKMTPGAAGPNGPFVDVAPGERYMLRYWFKGEKVERDPATIQVYYVDRNKGEKFGVQGQSLTGTNDWTPIAVEFTPPAGTVQIRFYVQTAGLGQGAAWFDDFEVVRESNNTIIARTRFEPADHARFEDWAHFGFEDGRMMRSYQFGKPSIGGEHGIEHVTGDFLQSPYINGRDNGVKDVNVNDPGFRWDKDGIHFHNWLWGTTMGGMSSATGMWWYVNASHRHYLALSEYMAACAGNFVLLNSYKSTTPGDPITSDNRSLFAFGKTDTNRAYVYIMNSDHCLSRMIRDQVTPTPQDATIQIKGLAPGAYRVDWWDTYYADTSRATSPILKTENLTTNEDGILDLKVTGLVKDVAVQVLPRS